MGNSEISLRPYGINWSLSLYDTLSVIPFLLKADHKSPQPRFYGNLAKMVHGAFFLLLKAHVKDTV